ncbi:MAG: molybdopterin converting factor subunit 1 [Gemmatimonadota bacterium]
MRVNILLFAHYRELAGTDAVALELPDGATAADAVARLRAAGATLARIPAAPALAVNEAYAPLETALADGDEVALLPPVAGG